MALIDQLDRLHSQLLTSGISRQNNALFQVIDQLIDALRKLADITGTISGGGGGGGSTVTNIFNQNTIIQEEIIENEENIFMIGSSSSSPSSSTDHVVMSDGGIPTPLPVDDGAGNFIYIPYVP